MRLQPNLLEPLLKLPRNNIMSFLDTTFNVNDLPASQNIGEFTPLPEGWYDANIAGAELKTTKAGNGQYISIQYSIIGPTHQGRVVFGNLNIRNPNPKAEEIGRQQLGDLMRAIGLASVSDTDQLIGGMLSIKLKIRKSDQYGDSNDISSYKALTGGVPVMPKKESSPADKSPPWAK